MKTTFDIENLKCDGCVKSATEGVSKLEGVSNVSVSLESKSITFESVNKETISIVKEKLKEIGYPRKEEISLLDKAKSYLNK